MILSERVPLSYACYGTIITLFLDIGFSERNGMERLYELQIQFCGAKMVPNLTKPPYTEIQRDMRLYMKNFYFKPFLQGFINTYGKL